MLVYKKNALASQKMVALWQNAQFGGTILADNNPLLENISESKVFGFYELKGLSVSKNESVDVSILLTQQPLNLDLCSTDSFWAVQDFLTGIARVITY